MRNEEAFQSWHVKTFGEPFTGPVPRKGELDRSYQADEEEHYQIESYYKLGFVQNNFQSEKVKRVSEMELLVKETQRVPQAYLIIVTDPYGKRTVYARSRVDARWIQEVSNVSGQ